VADDIVQAAALARLATRSTGTMIATGVSIIFLRLQLIPASFNHGTAKDLSDESMAAAKEPLQVA
jgi:hypothetical protein